MTATKSMLKRVNYEFNKVELHNYHSTLFKYKNTTAKIMKKTDMRRLQYLLPYLKIDIIYEYLIHS